MEVDDVDAVIEGMEDVEDDVLRLIEHDPQLIKADGMFDVLKQLKTALSSMRDARVRLIDVVSAAEVRKRGHALPGILGHTQ